MPRDARSAPTQLAGMNKMALAMIFAGGFILLVGFIGLAIEKNALHSAAEI
jgi:hypothetical protein